MKNRIWIVWVFVVVSIFSVSCSLFEDDLDYDTYSTNVSFDYFLARGFNLRFVGVMKSTRDIMTNENDRTFVTGISLNIDNILVVSDDDIITMANEKWKCYETGNSLIHNPVFVNCERNPIVARFDTRTILHGGHNQWTGTFRFNNHTFEFEVHDGFLTLSLPAKYQMGSGNAALPLKGSEVERIIREGKEGVDYTLFTRDGKTYVRIGANLYERRYESWVYAGIADPFFLTSWVRFQTTLIFQITDWDKITEPYLTRTKNNPKVESRMSVVMEPTIYGFRTMSTGKGITFGNIDDPRDIITPMPCK